jgi:hypothetical protein
MTEACPATPSSNARPALARDRKQADRTQTIRSGERRVGTPGVTRFRGERSLLPAPQRPRLETQP